MLVDLVGIYSTLGGQKRAQSVIHWAMFRPNPGVQRVGDGCNPKVLAS